MHAYEGEHFFNKQMHIVVNFHNNVVHAGEPFADPMIIVILHNLALNVSCSINRTVAYELSYQPPISSILIGAT